jgi:hypothetical protein
VCVCAQTHGQEEWVGQCEGMGALCVMLLAQLRLWAAAQAGRTDGVSAVCARAVAALSVLLPGSRHCCLTVA